MYPKKFNRNYTPPPVSDEIKKAALKYKQQQHEIRFGDSYADRDFIEGLVSDAARKYWTEKLKQE